MTSVMQQPGMVSNMEPMGAPSSFTARKPAASHLPAFELPPPPLSGKFAPISTIPAPPAGLANFSVGNLLTPPSHIPGDSLSPMSSGANSGNNTAANQGQPPYTPTGYWTLPGSGLTPYAFPTGTTPQPWPQSSYSNSLFPPRGLFSPSLNSLVRNNNNSPTASEGLPPPPPQYEINALPSFPTSSAPMSGSGGVPAPSSQQQQQQQQMSYMHSQAPISAMTSQTSPLNPPDGYLQRPPPTPTYYGGSQPSSTPQQSQFPAFTAPSPTGPRISPTHSQPPMMQPPSTQQMQYPRPYPNYPLGPILSNLHSPGGNMQLVGGMGGMMPTFNSGHAAHMQMYGNQPQPAPTDRPFKCDQCPQSFNRNHDLKRHKRIHLAVKPFPCGHCEKSFSRKDALKRHILVKGCGKSPGAGGLTKAESDSPIAKEEDLDSDDNESPMLDGHD